MFSDKPSCRCTALHLDEITLGMQAPFTPNGKMHHDQVALAKPVHAVCRLPTHLYQTCRPLLVCSQCDHLAQARVEFTLQDKSLSSVLVQVRLSVATNITVDLHMCVCR